MRAAQICSVLAKVNGAKAEASDFMPKFGPPAELIERSDDDLLLRALKTNALMGGTVRRNDGE
jgi:hypothetical protein